MTSKDLDKFAEIMMGLAENYPGTRLTGTGLDMRFEALKDFSIDQVERAAMNLIRTHRFNSMPTVADFIDVMGGGQADKAEIEAGKVLNHLHRFGARKPPRFEDPITRHLMEGRWRYFSWASQVQETELKWWARDFIRAYKAHAVGPQLRIDFIPFNELVQGITLGGEI